MRYNYKKDFLPFSVLIKGLCRCERGLWDPTSETKVTFSSEKDIRRIVAEYMREDTYRRKATPYLQLYFLKLPREPTLTCHLKKEHIVSRSIKGGVKYLINKRL